MASCAKKSTRAAAPRAAEQQSQQLRSVKRLRIDSAELHGFNDDFFARCKSDEEFLWNARRDPLGTEQAVSRCFKHVVTWLPEDVLHELLRFFFDPTAPPALWISGLPVDSEIPPTPALPGDFRLPICEAWLLGVARCLGVPYGMLGFYTENARGGLIRDLSPKPGLGGINQPRIRLGFHRDVPACVSGSSCEPDGFLLLAARGDPEHGAKTLVCSNKLLAAGLSPAELTALRRSQVRTECIRHAADDAVSPYGQPFYAVEGPEEDPQITLFYIPEHKDFSYRIVSDDSETKAAYDHAAELAAELCDEVDLQAGDMLVINNARCNHGRTAFEPQLDGSDRWLLKTFVLAGGWHRPGQLRGDGPLDWPNLLVK